MKYFDEDNLSPVRRRTLERLSQAALTLYQQNKFPGAEEITRQANYAKVTLKTYFSTHNEFIEYIVNKTLGSFQRPPTGDDVNENLRVLLSWGYGELYTHEALMRDALRIGQLRWQQAQNGHLHPDENSKAVILKNSNRKEALEDALSPLSTELPEEKCRDLTMLLSLLYGTEAMTVLKDTYGLSREEIIELTTRGASILVQHMRDAAKNESTP